MDLDAEILVLAALDWVCSASPEHGQSPWDCGIAGANGLVMRIHLGEAA